MFKVFALREKTRLPESGIYFVVGKDGIYLHKDSEFFQGMVKVEGISFLKEVNAFARSKLPKLPRAHFQMILGFFREIHEVYDSEAIILLHYSAEKKEYRLVCPEQTVSATGIGYKASERIDGFQLVGSIHSHNTMPAFHSSIDVGDEKNFDGLHVTVGNLDREYFSACSSIVLNNNRFSVDSDTVIDGIVRPDIAGKENIVLRDNAIFFEISESKKVLISPGKNVFPKKWMERVKHTISYRGEIDVSRLSQWRLPYAN